MKNIRQKFALSIVCLIFLAPSLLTADNSLIVRGQTPVTIVINRVAWGTNLNTPVDAYAGDVGDSLIVEALNNSNSTIKGIRATLTVSYPLSDSNGNYKLNATGTPEVIGGSPVQQVGQTGDVLPGGFFTFTFTNINISAYASAQAYVYNLTVSYLINATSYFPSGSTTLNIRPVVSKASTTVSCSASPQSIEKGESIDVTGSITPTRENVTVTLLYKKPNGSTLNRTVMTAADGSYKDSYQPDIEGTWNINASWTGDSRYKGNWASASFQVTLPVSLTLSTSDTRLVGGMDNPLNITLLNSGGASLSSIDATLTISSPLILRGDNHWTIKNLNATNSIVIPLMIFAPSTSIGATSQGQIQISYRDSYGQTHTDTHPIGLQIVGRIELVVYGKSINPQPSSPGSKATFTATILNRGNTIATYGNASLTSNPVLDLSDESTTYIGDIEDNSPTPFTVSATVKPDTPNGTYPVRIVLFYCDDQYHNYSLNITMTLTVAKSQSGQSSISASGGIAAFLKENGLIIAVLIVASISVIFLYRRRLSKLSSKANP